jgi:hypothetical protein
MNTVRVLALHPVFHNHNCLFAFLRIADMFTQSTSKAELDDVHADTIKPAAKADGTPEKGKGKGGVHSGKRSSVVFTNLEDGSAETPEGKGANETETPEKPTNGIVKKEKKTVNWVVNGMVDEKKTRQWMQQLSGDIFDGHQMVPKLKSLDGSNAKKRLWNCSAETLEEHAGC